MDKVLINFRNPFPKSITYIVGSFTDWEPIQFPKSNMLSIKLSDGIHPYWYIVNNTITIRPSSLTIKTPVSSDPVNYIVIKYGMVDKQHLLDSVAVGDTDAMDRLGDHHFIKWRYYVSTKNIIYAYENYKAKIIQYYTMSNSVYAAKQLGQFYKNIVQYKYDVIDDTALEKCERYYKIAIEMGDSDAMNSLAKLYLRTGNRAFINYFKQAITAGNSRAMINYGKWCNNMTDSPLYYDMAIKEGNSKGYIEYAKLFTNNKKQFMRFIEMAINAGNAGRAYRALGDYYDCKGSTGNAVKNYLLATQNGDIESFNMLCKHYTSIDRDIDKSLYYCKEYKYKMEMHKKQQVK